MQLAKLNKALQAVSAIPAGEFHIEGGVDYSIISSSSSLHTLSVKVEEQLPSMILPNEARLFLSKLDSADIELDTGITIRHPKGRASFPRIDPSLYSSILEVIPEQTFEIDAQELKNALAATMHSVEKDNHSHPGIWFLPQGVFGTDGRSLARYMLKGIGPFQLPLFAIPVLQHFEGSIRIESNASLVRFISKNIDYTTVLHPGSPPDFDKFINTPQSIEFEVVTRDLLEALKRLVSATPKERPPVVEFELGDELTLRSEFGFEVLSVQTLPFKAKFDGSKLVSLLSKIPAEKITVQLNPQISFNYESVRVFTMGVYA